MVFGVVSRYNLVRLTVHYYFKSVVVGAWTEWLWAKAGLGESGSLKYSLSETGCAVPSTVREAKGLGWGPDHQFTSYASWTGQPQINRGFTSQSSLYLGKILRIPKRVCLSVLFLGIFTMLDTKLRNVNTFINSPKVGQINASCKYTISLMKTILSRGKVSEKVHWLRVCNSLECLVY